MVDLLAFLPACFALNLAFGPNNLLSVTYGARRGVAFAVTAGIARVGVFVPMIIASALGLGLLLSISALVFTMLKILGAAYLVYLGVRLLLSATRPTLTDGADDTLTLGSAARNEGVVAASNPKAILIFAAFFPQFVDVQHYWPSYAVVAGLFLLLEMVAILLYGALGRLARVFTAARLHWLQRASGVGMIVFGTLLLLARQPARTV